MKIIYNIRILLVILTVVLSYYSCQDFEAEPWLETEVINHRLELVSTNDIKNYSFRENGFVAACLGTINGPLTGPLYFWKILVDGSLKIYDHSEKEIEVIRKYKIINGYVITSSGKYKYERIN